MQTLLSGILNGVVLLALAVSLIVWWFYQIDPLLQIARAAFFTRCGLIIASRHVLIFWREWRRDTVRLYRHMRAQEGI